MKKILTITYSLLFLNFTSTAQLLNDSYAKSQIIKGLDLMYNYDFAGAEANFAPVKAKYPKHPVQYLLSAMLLNWQYFPIEQHPKQLSIYIDLLDKCVESAEKIEADSDKKAEATFFLLASHGYKALVLTHNKEQIKAVNEARKAYKYLLSGNSFIQKNPEFLFTSGLYTYYRVQYPETHPVVKPLMFFFEDGNKKIGLNYLEQAVAKSVFSRTEAAYYLTGINLKYESNYTKAFYYSTWLHNHYPNNLYYLTRHTESLLMLGKYEEAEEHIQTLRKNKVYTLAGMLFEGIFREKYQKNDKAATEMYNSVLKIIPSHGFNEDYYAMALAGLARIAIRNHDTKRAEILYKKCLDYAEYNSTITEAKKYLNK